MAVIGSGFQAQSQIEAIRCVRDLTDIRVWNRSKEKRETFAGANQRCAAPISWLPARRQRTP
jgi:ornithine cyclodeaminase/alanine dehydrogenase-like protein (mu-crystallin family)